MAQVLPNTTTTNNYKDTVLGMSGYYQDGTLTIANNPVSILLRKRSKDPGSPYDTEYTYVSPTTIPIVAGDKEWIVGLQVKSAIAGTPAQVFGWLQEPGTAGFAPGTPFTQTIAASGSVGVANFLGRFTQAQWPPSNGNAGTGDVAVLADNYGNWDPFSVALENQPGIDPVNPWRPYNAQQATMFTKTYVLNNTDARNTTNVAVGTLLVPVAGSYTITLNAGGGSFAPQAAATLTIYCGSTLGGTDIASNAGTAGLGVGVGPSAAVTFTATKGQTLFINYSGNAQALLGLATVKLLLNKVANA